MNSYQYTHLDPRNPEFRLLRIHKGDTGTIKCDIFKALISGPDTPPYEALSYTWGNPELVEQIEVNGQKLWITDNLYAAIQHLRVRDHDRILWIDAICINQDDKSERSQQVVEMGRIFSCASRVIFWLGKPTAEASLLMESLVEVQAEHATLSRGGAQTENTPLEIAWDNLQARLPSSNGDILAQCRKGLEVLLNRPWFERVWILQEVYNARAAVVCCGPFSISARVFARSPSLLGNSASEHVQSVLQMMPGPVPHYSDCSRARDDLVTLLSKFHACKATDPRDMIFALLGMASDPSAHVMIRPDYTKPLLEVVENVIRYWMTCTTASVRQVLDVLSDLKTIRTTYIVPPKAVTRECEIQVDFLSDLLLCTRDPSLFFIDHDQGESSQVKRSFNTEVNSLQPRIPDATARQVYLPALEIESWARNPQNVKVVVLREVTYALDMLATNKCKQMFMIVGDRFLSDELGPHDAAMVTAAERGQHYTVELMLHKGVNVNAQTESGTALQVAAFGHRVRVMQTLLNKGADVNAQGRTYGTALIAAATKGFTQPASLLLDSGADVNARGGSYGSALQAAIAANADNLVQTLLDRGANINDRGGIYGSALNAASALGKQHLVQMLLGRGADINVRGGQSGSEDLRHPLFVASQIGHDRVAQLLLDRGADINALGGDEGTALSTASLRGIDYMVQMLLWNKADVNASAGLAGSALQAASRGGHEYIVSMLLCHGADVNARGGRNHSALNAALTGGHHDVVRLLLQHGAKPE